MCRKNPTIDAKGPAGRWSQAFPAKLWGFRNLRMSNGSRNHFTPALWKFLYRLSHEGKFFFWQNRKITLDFVHAWTITSSFRCYMRGSGFVRGGEWIQGWISWSSWALVTCLARDAKLGRFLLGGGMTSEPRRFSIYRGKSHSIYRGKSH